MSSIKIYNTDGKKTGEIEFSPAGLVLDKGGQAVKDVVVAVMAGRRAGTASTLNKGSVAGSNKKPWQQKGLGRARAGYRQSPVWRGGGVAFGPHPRSYEQKINRKVMDLAFRRVLSEAINESRIKVLESIDVPEFKTKVFAGILKNLGIKKHALIVDSPLGAGLLRVARNIPTVEVVDAKVANVYQLLRYGDIVATRAGMDVLKNRLERSRVKAGLAAENVA